MVHFFSFSVFLLLLLPSFVFVSLFLYKCMTFKKRQNVSTTCTICSNEVEMVIKNKRLNRITDKNDIKMKPTSRAARETKNPPRGTSDTGWKATFKWLTLSDVKENRCAYQPFRSQFVVLKGLSFTLLPSKQNYFEKLYLFGC